MERRAKRGLVAGAAGVLLLLAAPAPAQQLGLDSPIGKFAADIRGAFARNKKEPSTADELVVVPGNVPARSFGFSGGAHVYPWHAGKITFGVGANVVYARGSHTIDSDATLNIVGATVDRHFMAMAPEVSFNFGHRQGYSYISGGMFGVSKLFLERADAPVSGAPWRSTLNYGAGARWFVNQTMAFSVDARWYSVAQQDADATRNLVAQPRTTLLVLSAGIAIR